jgi:hypothetical protein
MAAFYILYALYFLCLTLAKLMVLDGLSQHTFEFVDGLTQDAAGHTSLTSSMPKTLKFLKIANAAVVATVCACNAVGLTANSVAAYFFSNGADLEAKAARKYGRGDTDANQTLSEASKAFTSGNAANSVHNYSEALVLNLVLLVFVAAVLSATRVLRVADGMAQDIIKASQRQAKGKPIFSSCVMPPPPPPQELACAAG